MSAVLSFFLIVCNRGRFEIFSNASAYGRLQLSYRGRALISSPAEVRQRISPL